MNQSIQILDGAVYELVTNSLKIEAISAGQIVQCYISGADKETLLSLYANQQFDIEELLERLIEDECFDANGNIHLNSAQLV